ncbi:hypothetical protein HCJ52_04915 [Listeria sp. FSL L7-1485]|uniref:Uncharacterized protein n=1 Tax=Listeria immobilis TaxID=2713502 RepID=A0A7X0X5V3_9LIST|nr:MULTISPECIES: hypothetical protein [Listeria]MBC1488050.1 hypothetical protein [Listeria immobilis]MBC1516184.1 hypothetical protein [Listeria immobilis]MBC1535463.1 hypothetical protein [Listeria immobilis]MBC1832463.1 hypothetical protein [Listeria seeligeri]MBC1870091.1 hypothetical protein [Listeria seeligeri]
MNIFKIGDTDFGIGEVVFNIDKENHIFDLKIKGNKEFYKQIKSDESSEWNWTLYAPEVYFRNISCQHFDTIEITIDDALLDEYDIALYLMEYNDFFGTLIISDNCTEIKGETEILGEIYDLEILVERTI